MILTRFDLDVDAPKKEYGERPTMIERNADCSDCGQVHDLEACPKCGADIDIGYGFALGSLGEYKVCEKACGWFWLRPDWDAMEVEVTDE